MKLMMQGDFCDAGWILWWRMIPWWKMISMLQEDFFDTWWFLWCWMISIKQDDFFKAGWFLCCRIIYIMEDDFYNAVWMLWCMVIFMKRGDFYQAERFRLVINHGCSREAGDGQTGHVPWAPLAVGHQRLKNWFRQLSEILFYYVWNVI